MARTAGGGRPLLARIALAIAAAAAVGTGVLLLHGGFETWIFGIRIKASDPVRPFLLAFAAALTFVLSVADDGSDAAMARILDFFVRLIARVDLRLPALAIAIGVVAVGIQFGSKSAGGSDSYGYISQAELWLSGRLTIAQPWTARVPWPDADFTFSPLGYHPGTAPGTIVPTYSAGLPLLMALAKRVGGQCAIFAVVPICGALMILATFALCRRVAGGTAALTAAWLLATSPPFLFMLLNPMSDVPAAAAWTVALWCAFGGTVRWAALSGLATTAAVLIRPNLAPLAALPAAWLFFDARARLDDHLRRMSKPAAFLAGALPGIIITALLNQLWNGSPWTSGYGNWSDIFSLARVWPNVRTYAAWLSQTQTPLVFAGIAALLLPARWLWPDRVRQSRAIVLGLFVLAIWAEYSAYYTFGAWWDLRFLLPAYGCLAVGMAVVIDRTRRLTSAWITERRAVIAASLVATLLVGWLGWRGVSFAARAATFDQQTWETKYPAAAAMVAARTEPGAVILSGLHSGSLRYYAGRMTLTYTNLRPDWLDRATLWLEARGAHPYALLEKQEVEEFKIRFGAGNDAGKLAMTPTAFYDGPSKLYLFDLLRPPGNAEPAETITDPAPVARCVPPAPPPAFALR